MTFNRNGTTTVEVNGVQGPGCKDMLAKLQEALGVKTLKDDNKPEYYEPAVESDTVNQGGW